MANELERVGQAIVEKDQAISRVGNAILALEEQLKAGPNDDLKKELDYHRAANLLLLQQLTELLKEKNLLREAIISKSDDKNRLNWPDKLGTCGPPCRCCYARSGLPRPLQSPHALHMGHYDLQMLLLDCASGSSCRNLDPVSDA